MGFFGKLFDGGADSALCLRCGKKALRSEEFFAKCEEAGLAVDRDTGEVKARLGGFSTFGTMMDASAMIAGQRRSQQEIVEALENQRGFRCTGCGAVYCMKCLFNHAPAHPGGGKACPKCESTFELLG
jgi:aerobic-type carbon monoxide dehydrogenase small subunit (CoxS/CutS family)